MEVVLKNQSLVNISKQQANILTVYDAINAPVPSLALIRKQHGEETVKDYLQLTIIQFNELLNANSKMNDEQIILLSEKILKEYYFLKTSDFKLFFEKLEKQKIFGQLSPQLILEELNKYFNHRCEVAADRQKDISEGHKNNLTLEHLPLEAINAIAKNPKIKEGIKKRDERKMQREAQIRYLREKGNNNA